LNTQKVLKITKIFHCKLLGQKDNKMIKHSVRVACQHNIINIEEKDQNVRLSTSNKHGSISMTTEKSIRQQKATKSMKPSMRCLLQTMYGLFKICAHALKILSEETRTLFHVNFLT